MSALLPATSASFFVLNPPLLGSTSSLSSGTLFHYKFDGTSWTKVSDLPFPFSFGGAVEFCDEIHILGSVIDGYEKYHYKWDGTTWTEVGTLPFGFESSCIEVLNNKIHILGSNYTNTTRKYHYNFDGISWSEIGTLPYELPSACVKWNNRIHIMGSTNENYYKYHYEVCHTVYEKEVL